MQKNKSLKSYAIIFDIQRFSLHDGPGIRTTLFFKGCPIRCVWCQNPESHKIQPEIAFYIERCKETYNCMRACPKNAILKSGQHRIDYSKCDSCGICVSKCAFNAVKIIGKKWYLRELVDEILKDRDYFFDSGGGVTLSGGSPMMQFEFLEEFLPQLKKNKIHVNIETCGVFKWEKIKKIVSHLDLIYYDLKHMDPLKHKMYTGMDNSLILSNFEKLAKVFPELQPRMPVIPGINDGEENILSVIQFLKDNKKESIHCLPYHNLGEAKLCRLNSSIKPLELQDIDSEYLERVRKIFESGGINIVIYE